MCSQRETETDRINTDVLTESDKSDCCTHRDTVTECFTEHCSTHTQNTQSASENTAVLTESGRVLHRTLLYSYIEYTECLREHCCTHREWQSASQNTAVFTESGRVLHRTQLYSQSGRVLQRTLLYSLRVTEFFREHCCTHRE